MSKTERFNAVFEHLRHTGVIKTQKDVADKMGSTSQNVGQALQGNPKVLTDRFLMRFIQAFPDIFSMQWLFTGDGSMLINAPAPTPAPESASRPYSLPDMPPVIAAEAAPLSDRDLLVATYTTLVRLSDSFRDYQSRTESRIRDLESLISQLLPNVSPNSNNKTN